MTRSVDRRSLAIRGLLLRNGHHLDLHKGRASSSHVGHERSRPVDIGRLPVGSAARLVGRRNSGARLRTRPCEPAVAVS